MSRKKQSLAKRILCSTLLTLVLVCTISWWHSRCLLSVDFSKEKSSEQTTGKRAKNDTIDIPNYVEEATFGIGRQIRKTCAKYKINSSPIRRHFLYNSQDRWLHCWIRKVASTSFTKFFAQATNHNDHEYITRKIDALAPQSSELLDTLTRNDNQVLKILAVRHPFERLVSSYRDRIEDNTKYTDQAWIYARRIFRLTRPEIFRSNGTSGSLQKIYTSDKRLRLVPSFAEFVRWLVQIPTSQDDDVHWDTYYKHCAICNINYTIVLKLDDDTVAKRMNEILSKVGRQNGNKQLPHVGTSLGGPTNFERTCRYIGTLSHETVLKLYEKYRIDFESFNYTLNKYRSCIEL